MGRLLRGAHVGGEGALAHLLQATGKVKEGLLKVQQLITCNLRLRLKRFPLKPSFGARDAAGTQGCRWVGPDSIQSANMGQAHICMDKHIYVWTLSWGAGQEKGY